MRQNLRTESQQLRNTEVNAHRWEGSRKINDFMCISVYTQSLGSIEDFLRLEFFQVNLERHQDIG